MRMNVLEVDKLIYDLECHGIIVETTYTDDIIRIRTAKILLLIYLPNSVRQQESEDIKVIHLDYDLLKSSYTKVLQRIRGLMGFGKRIYARETVVARIDKKVSLEFLDEYHVNGSLAGKYRYGLFYQGELVSVALFSGGRVMREISDEHRSFELLRFCHKADYLVIGGISKLVKAFINDFKPNDIMTYADRDWSQQSSLESIGFKQENVTSAQTFYVKEGKRLTVVNGEEGFDYIIKNMGSIKLKLYL